MEYNQEAFEIRDTIGNFHSEDVSRARYNSAAWNPEAQLLDISDLTLSIEPELVDQFAAINKMLLSEDHNGIFIGSDFKLNLISAKTAPLVNFIIGMTLTKSVPEEKSYTLGSVNQNLI